MKSCSNTIQKESTDHADIHQKSNSWTENNYLQSSIQVTFKTIFNSCVSQDNHLGVDSPDNYAKIKYFVKEDIENITNQDYAVSWENQSHHK